MCKCSEQIASLYKAVELLGNNSERFIQLFEIQQKEMEELRSKISEGFTVIKEALEVLNYNVMLRKDEYVEEN